MDHRRMDLAGYRGILIRRDREDPKLADNMVKLHKRNWSVNHQRARDLLSTRKLVQLTAPRLRHGRNAANELSWTSDIDPFTVAMTGAPSLSGFRFAF
jgi:hypothetical protein